MSNLDCSIKCVSFSDCNGENQGTPIDISAGNIKARHVCFSNCYAKNMIYASCFSFFASGAAFLDHIAIFRCGDYSGTYPCTIALNGNCVSLKSTNSSFTASNSGNTIWSTIARDSFVIDFLVVYMTRSYTMFTHSDSDSTLIKASKSLFLDDSPHGRIGYAINVVSGSATFTDSVFNRIMFGSFSSTSSFSLDNCFFSENQFPIPRGGQSVSVSAIYVPPNGEILCTPFQMTKQFSVRWMFHFLFANTLKVVNYSLSVSLIIYGTF